MIAQHLDIISRSAVNREPYPPGSASVFIHPDTDTGQLQFVGTYKAIGKDRLSTPGDLFLLIKKQAREHGANCFSLRSFFQDSMNQSGLVIDAYYGSDSVLTAINAGYETNVVYLFCPEKVAPDSFTLKINDSTRTFSTGTYLKFVLKEGEPLNLNKGGFIGARAKIKYRHAKPPLYLMVFGGKGMLPPTGTIGVTFTTGEIKEMTDDYGQFLVQILKQSN